MTAECPTLCTRHDLATSGPDPSRFKVAGSRHRGTPWTTLGSDRLQSIRCLTRRSRPRGCPVTRHAQLRMHAALPVQMEDVFAVGLIGIDAIS